MARLRTLRTVGNSIFILLAPADLTDFEIDKDSLKDYLVDIESLIFKKRLPTAE
jgi:hypothetical protein